MEKFLSSADLSPPNSLGTVSISALAPAAAATWLRERDSGTGGGSGTSSVDGGSFVGSGELLQRLLASVAQSREFAALLRQAAAREEEEKEGEEER